MKKKVKGSKKSGQSEIITTVLIILLVLAAIIILWNIVMPLIQKSSKDIDVNPLTNTVSIESVKLYINGDVDVKVGRSSGNQNIDSMQIVFYDVNGGRYVKTVSNPLKVGEIILYAIKSSAPSKLYAPFAFSLLSVVSVGQFVQLPSFPPILSFLSPSNFHQETSPISPGLAGTSGIIFPLESFLTALATEVSFASSPSLLFIIGITLTLLILSFALISEAFIA